VNNSEGHFCFFENLPSLNDGSNRTIKYCYYPPKESTQHYFTVEDIPDRQFTLESYNDANNIHLFGLIQANRTMRQGVPWGKEFGLNEPPAIQNSTSQVVIYEFADFIIPQMTGWATAVHTSSTCKAGFPNG
jgi:hypothetical protein